MPEPEQGVASDPKSIGKYDVVERIADGGFAVLYKGYDPFLKRSVAIKVCVSQDAELRQQFLREAEIAGQLDHPNIVRTFDFGFESAGPFLIQEYLEGEDLEHKIKRGDELSLRGKLGLLQEVAEGLAYSHDRGVLHLDIKPANIRLPEAVDGSSSGVKILDFGIGQTGLERRRGQTRWHGRHRRLRASRADFRRRSGCEIRRLRLWRRCI